MGRLIVDGVVDSYNYMDSECAVFVAHVSSDNPLALWSNNLRDTDAELHNLFVDCVDAGPTLCPIYEETPEAIRNRVDRLLNNLQNSPQSYYNTTDGSFDVIDRNAAKTMIFWTLYKPHGRGYNLTYALAALEDGDAAPAVKLSGVARELKDFLSCPCGTDGPSRDRQFLWETSTAIACGDGRPVTDSLEELREYYDDMAKTSIFAEVWQKRIHCA